MVDSRVGMLSTTDHDRAVAGMTYVYPVVSRRSGGVSIGINLNPNNACDWRCIYCQVPNLVRGMAPTIDMVQLDDELRTMLDDIMHGDYMERFVPESCRRLSDLAFSGNGEPTSSNQFADIVDLVGGIMLEFGLAGVIPIRLITNGSYTRKGYVQQGLRRICDLGGEVWIKVDRASRNAIHHVNGVSISTAQIFEQVEIAASVCPTWIQTCMFAWDGEPPGPKEIDAYIDFLAEVQAHEISVQGVMLYGLARPSMQQPEAARLSPVPGAWLQALARRIEDLGLVATAYV